MWCGLQDAHGSGNKDRISFDLTAIPDGIDRIVVAASRYDGAHFGELHDLQRTLVDGSGESLLRFTIDDAGPVSAGSNGYPALTHHSGRQGRPATGHSAPRTSRRRTRSV